MAARIGARLGFTGTENPPKILPRCGGKPLLQFHIEILRRHGLDESVTEVPPRILTAESDRRAAMMIKRDMSRDVAQGV